MLAFALTLVGAFLEPANAATTENRVAIQRTASDADEATAPATVRCTANQPLEVRALSVFFEPDREDEDNAQALVTNIGLHDIVDRSLHGQSASTKAPKHKSLRFEPGLPRGPPR